MFVLDRIVSRKTPVLSACAAALAFAIAGAAQAGLTVVNIGGGWTAEWDDALNPFVSINSHGVVGNAVFIEKSAQFTQGPNAQGVFPSIAIVFRQLTPSAVTNIVIEDEIISNSTGTDWTDFHMEVTGSPFVAFDPVATLNSGGGGPIGFSIAPFTTASFANGNTLLNIAGGVVPDGSTWFPGSGATDGQLWINVANPTPTNLVVFTLLETPTPAPGALALLGLAGALTGGRRRRV